MMRRRPNALLHRAEVDTLARLRRGRTKVIRREHEDLLISMGLVQISENGRLRLTKDGLRRLNEKGQAHQLMPGVDDLIEPGPEQIVRLRRLALLGSHANLRSSASHSQCRGSTAKNASARVPRLMALNLAISKVLPEPKSIPAQAPMGFSRPTTYSSPLIGSTRAPCAHFAVAKKKAPAVAPAEAE